MPMRLLWRETWSVWMVVCAFAAIMAGAAPASDEVPDVDPAGVSDPVERRFYQDLRELREKQRRNREELGKEDLTPEERIEKRRAMLLHDHQALQELEASYQSKLTPEARTRWMERKINRQKRFDKLKSGPDPASRKSTETVKASKKKSP